VNKICICIIFILFSCCLISCKFKSIDKKYSVDTNESHLVSDPSRENTNWAVNLLPFLPKISKDIPLGDSPVKKANRYCSPNKMSKLKNNSLDRIIQMAKEHQIVVINEAHGNARHRAYIFRLLEGLRPLGYSIYASETFHTGDFSHDEWSTNLQNRRYAVNEDGFYLREPIFGQLVRHSIELGYKPIAYEPQNMKSAVSKSFPNMTEREVGQGQNLIERALEKYPEEKIIIHVGYSHGKEELDKNGVGWMAKYVKDMTKLDPLTISQTNCIAPHLPTNILNGIDTLYYDRSIASQSDLASNGFDINLIEPKTDYEFERAKWLNVLNRTLVNIPEEVMELDSWVFAEAHPAFYGDELTDAVPYDGVPNIPGRKVKFALESGTYIINAYDKEENLLVSTQLTVK